MLRDPSPSRNARPSYSERYAKRYIGLFDQIIEDGCNKHVLSNVVGSRPSTLMVYLNDSLRWLSDNFGPTSKYEVLRQKITFQRVKDGVMVIFKGDLESINLAGVESIKRKELLKTLIASGHVDEDAGEAELFKNAVIEWTMTAQAGQSLEFIKALTPHEVAWLESHLMAYEGMEKIYNFDLKTLTIRKL